MNEGRTGGGVLGKLGVKARGNLAFRQASVRVDVIRQLHACMREQRMGRTELADKSGKDRDEVTRMFSGVLPFTLDDLVSLAHALGARVEVRLVSEQEADQASMPEEERDTGAAVEPTSAMTAVKTIPEAVLMLKGERPEESVPAAVVGRAPAKTAVEAIEAIEAVDMMHGMKDSATQFLAEMQSAYQKERRERERRTDAASLKKPGGLSAAPAMSSPFHGVDVLNSMAGMEDMKDHDRQFLEDMQKAYHRESRNRLVGGEAKQPPPRPASSMVPRSWGATDLSGAIMTGMEDMRDQDHDQQFLDDMRMALEEGEHAASGSVVVPEASASGESPQDEEDASVVMDALAEMSGEEKHLFEEMWAAVQHDGDKRAPTKDLGVETVASAPKKAL